MVALRGVTFKVKRGDFVSIIGPSGSGKSTLLNLIGALDRPTKGKVIIDGVNVINLSDGALAKLRNRKIGFVFQSFNLINSMTALENVELPLVARGEPKERRRSKALKLLESLGVGPVANRLPSQMSGGQQQRVAIARALIADPEIILADEPTGSLSGEDTKVVMDILEDLNRRAGKTLIIVTHNPEVAARARVVIRIRDGKVMEIKESEV